MSPLPKLEMATHVQFKFQPRDWKLDTYIYSVKTKKEIQLVLHSAVGLFKTDELMST